MEVNIHDYEYYYENLMGDNHLDRYFSEYDHTQIDKISKSEQQNYTTESTLPILPQFEDKAVQCSVEDKAVQCAVEDIRVASIAIPLYCNSVRYCNSCT